MTSITSIECRRLQLPFNQPYVTGAGTLKTTQCVIVRVHTSDGLVGIGEACPYPTKFQDETPGTVMSVLEEILAPSLIGQNPLHVNDINRIMDAIIPGNPQAKAAIDVACWDILGKKLGAPIYQLLGGPLRTSLDLLWPMGDQTPAEDTKEVTEKVEEGFKTFMYKMGFYKDIDMEIERIATARKVFGKELVIVPDANQGFTKDEAIQLLRGLEPLQSKGPLFVEQPVSKERPQDMVSLQRQTSIPLSIDESLVTVKDALHFAQQQGCGVFSVKVVKNGGISKAKEICGVAKLYGIPCLFNSMLETGVAQAAALHLAAVTPTLYPSGHCFMSTLRLKDVTTFASSLIRKDNASGLLKVHLPTGPGLGISLDEEALEMHTVDRRVITDDKKAWNGKLE
ncbi:unnamed protein product [Vitrella brassicaformis CCMP3155]|uniref:Mandelate racemase/muconate lactonizing enzyme C-terminal domain-containing protein n=1 Tax=Vitrella brassicaformis (strain CCMP3155) TaxID=1169540 RepID=A0A0G4GRY3_VITBC|nr:unnamed protein product [Vitrella brassicaformis CCMP3155]|eukprot:CEM33372.1 unnamed protein product [Vitrella brassicaformis CCMP3155]